MSCPLHDAPSINFTDFDTDQDLWLESELNGERSGPLVDTIPECIDSQCDMSETPVDAAVVGAPAAVDYEWIWTIAAIVLFIGVASELFMPSIFAESSSVTTVVTPSDGAIAPEFDVDLKRSPLHYGAHSLCE